MNLVVTEEVVRRLRERRVFFEYFLSEHRLRVGDVVEFDEQAVVEPYCGIFAGLAVPTIGAFSFIRSALPPTFRIGRYCSIGPDVSAPFPRHPIEFAGSTSCLATNASFGFSLVAAALQDFDPGFDTFFPVEQKPMPVLGHDVWVGAGAQIMPGVTVGHGAVIAAAAVVTKDVAPYAIVGGNPARVIKMRFPERVAAMLLESEWWRYKFTDFAGLAFDEPERFCDQLQAAQLEPWAPEPIRLAELADAGG